MDTLLFVIITIIIVLVAKKDYTLIKRLKNNKSYTQAYKAVLNKQEDAYTMVCDFISSEKSAEFKQKGMIIKLLAEVINDLDYTNTLNQIDLTKIFLDKNGQINSNQINFNSDTFIFIILLMGRDYSLGKNIVSEYLLKKVNCIDLANRLEPLLVNDICKCLLDQTNEKSILKPLLDGEYSDYIYDKNMISLYKRFAAATLVCKGNKIDDYSNEDLKIFASSMAGKIYMEDLGIIEKYK